MTLFRAKFTSSIFFIPDLTPYCSQSVSHLPDIIFFIPFIPLRSSILYDAVRCVQDGEHEHCEYCHMDIGRLAEDVLEQNEHCGVYCRCKENKCGQYHLQKYESHVQSPLSSFSCWSRTMSVTIYNTIRKPDAGSARRDITNRKAFMISMCRRSISFGGIVVLKYMLYNGCGHFPT